MTLTESRKNSKFVRIMNNSYTVLGFLGIYFLCVACICAFFAALGTFFCLIISAIVFLLMLYGYVMQDAYCRLKKFKRKDSSDSYESNVKYYDKKRAFPVYIAALIPALPASWIVDRILFAISDQPGNYYEEDSIWPIFAAVLVFAVVAMGSFVWFFPYDRLLTGKSLFIEIAVLAITMVLCALGDGMWNPGVVRMDVVYAVGYGFCVLIVYNQRAMARTYRGTVAEFLTARARIYNMSMALVLSLIILAACGLFYIIVDGIFVLFVLLLYIFLNSFHSSGQEVEDTGADSKGVLSLMKEREDIRSSDFWFMAVFLLMCGLGLVYIIFRKQEAFKRFLNFLKEWLISLWESLVSPIRGFLSYRIDDDDGPVNYIDEEEKINQHASIREYTESSGTRRTWRQFQSALRGCKTDEERYRCAYSEFVLLYRRNVSAAKKSDTSREISGKYIRGKYAGCESVDKITDEFEKIEYGGYSADAGSREGFEKLYTLLREGLH